MNLKKVVMFIFLLTGLVYADSETIEKTVRGKSIEIKIEKGKEWSRKIKPAPLVTVTSTPQMAIWLENEDGKYLETIYITKKTKEWADKNPDPKTQKRIESLPYWSYKKGESKVLDGIAGATQNKNFNLSHKILNESEKFKMVMELNGSMDFNEYYTKKGKKGTIKSGFNGQPSLIYESIVDFKNLQESYTMEIVGHGSVDGSNGKLYRDLSKLTSVKDELKLIEFTIK